MDFNLQINGLNEHNYWKYKDKPKKKFINKSSNKENNHNEDSVNTHTHEFKSKLILLQDYISDTQDKINVLEVAKETLNDISGDLSNLRERTLNKINQLDDYPLSEELKEKLKNIDKLEKIQLKFKNLLDNKDKNYTRIIEEFESTSQRIINLAKNQDFEKDINQNQHIKLILNNINSTISSLSSTQKHLDEIKSDLINDIKNLSITMENMVSSRSKIRNIELASETVKLAQYQILNEANKGIKLYTPDSRVTVNRLVN